MVRIQFNVPWKIVTHFIEYNKFLRKQCKIVLFNHFEDKVLFLQTGNIFHVELFRRVELDRMFSTFRWF